MKFPTAFLAAAVTTATALPAFAATGHAMASAAGTPGEAARVTRTVSVTMNDSMRFAPGTLDVKAGETIRFFVKNLGQVDHEFLIGTDQELQAHAIAMRNMPGMHHGGNDGSITLKPEQSGAVIWTFSKPGTYNFGCTVPGHLEAGMRGQLKVQ